MSRRPNPTLIGGFAVGALALTALAVAVVGSGRFLKTSYPLVAYFEGAVNGLRVGAPVEFKGVPIGAVTGIFLQLDQSVENWRVPVTMEIDPEQLREEGIRQPLTREVLDSVIARGMRARLQSQSLLTGQLLVQLDFYPDSAAVYAASSSKLQEIPTLPAAADELQAALRRLSARIEQADFPGLVKQASGAAQALQELASSPEVKGAAASAQRALADVGALAVEVHRVVVPLSAHLGKTSERAQAAAGQLGGTAEQLQMLIDPQSPLMIGLVQTLADFGAAARSVRLVAEELERDPSVLLRGKQVGELP